MKKKYNLLFNKMETQNKLEIERDLIDRKRIERFYDSNYSYKAVNNVKKSPSYDNKYKTNESFTSARVLGVSSRFSINKARHHRVSVCVFEVLDLIDEYFVFHKLVETGCIHLWIHCRNQSFITLVQPNFNEVFCFLLKVKGLQVIDDCNMIDKLSVVRDKFVS